MNRTIARSLSLTVVLLVGACASDTVDAPDGTAADPSGPAITVTNNEFRPATLEVEVGDVVSWQFEQGAHDVVFSDLGSEVLTGGTWQRTFDAPGTFAYECTLHAGMTGTVVARAPV